MPRSGEEKKKNMLTPQSSITAAISPPRKGVSGMDEEAQRGEAFNFHPKMNSDLGSTDFYEASPLRGEDLSTTGPVGSTGTAASESAFPLHCSCPQQDYTVLRDHHGASAITARALDIQSSKNNIRQLTAQQGSLQRVGFSNSGGNKRMPMNSETNPADVADAGSVGSSNRCPNSPPTMYLINSSSNAPSGGDSRLTIGSISNFQDHFCTSTAVVRHSADSTIDLDYDVPASNSLVVFGYLFKKTRNGKWQRRFFETDGERLRYYKSEKRTKMLASLDLANVGEIVQDKSDPSGCSFTIQVAGRPYYLLAQDKSTCKDWVINLNRVREARIQLGRMKLVNGREEGKYAGRVVVRANRRRLHRLNSEEDLLELDNLPSAIQEIGRADLFLSRWEKRRTGLERIRYRLIVWAKRIRRLGCFSHENDVVLHRPDTNYGPASAHGSHSYPHGPCLLSDGTDTVGDSDIGVSKDDPSDNSKALHSDWISKETQISNIGVLKRIRAEVDGRRMPSQVGDDDDGARSLS